MDLMLRFTWRDTHVKAASSVYAFDAHVVLQVNSNTFRTAEAFVKPVIKCIARVFHNNMCVGLEWRDVKCVIVEI